MPPAPLTFETRVRHLLHVLLDQAALGAHLAAQVTLHALPGCGDAGEGTARPGAGPAGPPPEPRAPRPPPPLTLVDEAHVLLVGRREDLAAGAGGARAAAPLAVVDHAGHGGAESEARG